MDKKTTKLPKGLEKWLHKNRVWDKYYTAPNTWNYPSQESLGKGFYKKYKIPYGLTDRDFAKIYYGLVNSVTYSSYVKACDLETKFLALNPELKECFKLELDFENHIDSMMGALSRFLIEDISWFIINSYDLSDPHRNKKDIKDRRWGFVPSPTTYLRAKKLKIMPPKE